MRSKANAIYSSLLCNDYDIIILTETWLNADFKSEEFFPSCYSVFRRDREPNNSNLVGGGVIIAVNNNLIFDRINVECAFGESITVKVKCGSFWLFVVGVYIPFRSAADVYHGFTEFINSVIMPLRNDNDQVLLVGDFNLPKISWCWIDDDFMGSSEDNLSNNLLDSLAIIGMRQHNAVFNNYGRILDLVFSTFEVIDIEACPDLAGHSSIYHTPLLIKFYFVDFDDTNSVENGFKYNFRKTDVPGLNNFLDDVDWTILFEGLNVSAAVTEFYNIVVSGFELYVPKVITGARYAEPWFNRQLKNISNRKSRAFKKFKRSGNVSDKVEYGKLCKEFKFLNDFLYKMYILQIESEISLNPKRFYSFINKKRKQQGYPRSMTYNNECFSGSQETCNAFASFFQSSFVGSHLLNSSCVSDCCNNVVFQFCSTEILNGLERLNTSGSVGPDGISPWILRKCAHYLCEPLQYLFNLSLSSGSFPDIWKKSFVIPIFKSGSRSDITNYRGISILSVIPKLFECLVKTRLEFYIKNRISSRQHGFIQGRSTVTNLMVFSSDIFGTVGKRGQVDVIYTDFSKAFDRLDHTILLRKLINFGSDFIPIKWVASYLAARQQCVKISQVCSFTFNTTSGVPQGSHLGPLLFTIFINDVGQCFKFCRFLMYADDLKIYANIFAAGDTERMQDELDVFSDWSIRNKLPLNTNKCKVMTFCRTRLSGIEAPYILLDAQIGRVDNIRDLGVIFSCNLTFNKHIDNVISKGYSLLGFIKRNGREFCDPFTLRSLYVTYVRSVVEYASVIWKPNYQTHSDRIESIQKQFLIYALRRLPNLSHGFVREPYVNRLLLLNLQTLASRRETACAVFARDILSSRIDCSDLLEKFPLYAPLRALRTRSGLLRIPICNNNFGDSEPLINIFHAFNVHYDVFDFSISRELFKNRVRLRK